MIDAEPMPSAKAKEVLPRSAARSAVRSSAIPARLLDLPDPLISRTVEWIGAVNQENLSRVIAEIRGLLEKSHSAPIRLIINSHGGPTGISMTFFDLMTTVFKPNLETIGAGDVDSSGVILFLAGRRRALTEHTTLFLHMAGRYMDGSKRFTTADMSSMLQEDVIKDKHYASVIAGESGGKATTSDIFGLMRANTVLTSEDALSYGIAHEIIRSSRADAGRAA